MRPVNNFNEIVKDTLDEWIYFLKHKEIKEDFQARGLQKAKQELDILKVIDHERFAYERYQEGLHYQASMVESSYGVGRLKGRKEGKQEERINMAGNLMDILDNHIIAQKTGLTLAEVQKIRSKRSESEEK